MTDHKGRTLVFNPTAEEAIRQNNINYQPSKILAAFERDVAKLMPYIDTTIDDRSDKYVIWSDSPTIDRKIKGMDGRWSADKRLFHSRLTSVHIEQELANMKLPEWMEVEYPPIIIDSEEKYDPAYKVCKSLWSSSGRGVLIDPSGEAEAMRRRFVTEHVKNDRYAVQEIFLKRAMELAFLFYVHKEGDISYLGTNYYSSATNGSFGIEIIGGEGIGRVLSGYSEDIEKEAAEYLKKAIGRVVLQHHYHGYVGVDAMVYEGTDGKKRLRACVEANLRMTMGNINLGIRKKFPEGIKAQWSIVVKSKAEIPAATLEEALREGKGGFKLMEGEVFAAVGKIL